MGFTPKRKKLLDGATAAGTKSEWISTGNLEDLTLHIFGLTDGGVTIRASNEEGTPSNGQALGSEVTTDDYIVIDEIPYQLQVELTTKDTGSGVSAIMFGRIP